MLDGKVSVHWFKGLSAPGPARSRHVQTLWFTFFPFVWSVLELVRILKLRQSVNVIGFLIRSSPAISNSPCASPRSTLSDFRLGWEPNRLLGADSLPTRVEIWERS